MRPVLPLLACVPAAAALSCAARLEPGLVIFNRLPWFESLAWSEVVSNQSAALDFEYLRWGGDRDVFRAAHAMDARDVGLSHGDGLRLAKTIREIQHRSLPRRKQRVVLWERSFSFIEVPDVEEGRVAWINFVEDPVARATRSWRGSAGELDRCVAKKGAEHCVPCESMTAWFCGGGAMCDLAGKGEAALVRAKLVLGRDFSFVGVRERWADSLLVLEKFVPHLFEGVAGVARARTPTSADFFFGGGAGLAADLEPETVRKIRDANGLDAELYDHAVAHLEIHAQACLGRPLVAAPSPTERRPLEPVAFPTGLDDLAPLPADGAKAGACYSGEEARRTAPKSKGWFAKPKGKGRKKQDDDDAAHCFRRRGAARRAGVGLVARLLKMHPMVHGPGASLRFFGGRDERHPLDYAMHPSFALSKAQRRSSHVTFEASPEYGVRPGALREIRALLPDARLVFVLREPVARAYDEFWAHVRRGKLFRRDKELFVCHGAEVVGKEAATNAERLGGGPGAVAPLRCARARVPPTVASPLVFDAYARQLVFDAWEPDRRAVMKRAALNDSLPLDWELGALNDNARGRVFARSLYAPQLAALFSRFDRKQVHVLVYEQLLAPDTGPRVVAGLVKFLKLKGLKYQPDRIAAAAKSQEKRRYGDGASTNENGAVTNDYRPLLRKTRRLLEAFFTVDAELVKRMLPDLQIPW
ncbi:heparan sulfate 2-O-sulfotransferase [Aureococcus anophagefferens]|nr:heparan sulfate 2-O-sulfotransferase [Aureococcus anophagefferens]